MSSAAAAAAAAADISTTDTTTTDVVDIYLPASTPSAVRECYMQNKKTCGDKFFVCHYDVASLTVWSRSGHVRTGVGNTTQTVCKDEETLHKKVAKMLLDRRSREGAGRFVDATPPSAFPAPAASKKKVKTKKRKRENDDDEQDDDDEDAVIIEKQEDDEPPTAGFARSLRHTDGSRWYDIVYDGTTTGTLSFGKLADAVVVATDDDDGGDDRKRDDGDMHATTAANVKVRAGAGTTRPKVFVTVKSARKYFEGYVKKKTTKEGFVDADDADATRKFLVI